MAKPRGKNILKEYEVTNLLFFLAFVISLGVFVWWVFHSYDNPVQSYPKKPFDEKGILSEAVFSQSDSCLFYMGTELSESEKSYRSEKDVPTNDDGFIADLIKIPGVSQVIVDKKQVVLRKTPSGHWEAIQPMAREIITSHLHMHK
jgi:hypothetical protein